MMSRTNYPQSPIQHIITQQPNIEDTYEQFIEQLPFFPKYTYFHLDPNRSAYTLKPTFNTTYVHNIFKNYSQKWTQNNDSP